jgi:hypothetical protein
MRGMKLFRIALMLAAQALTPALANAMFDLPIRANKVEEVCMPLKAGTTLQWQFSADTPVDFNLHHHIGKSVVMPVELKALASHAGAHKIDHDNDWCLMWTAPESTAARVRGRWSVLPN